MKKSIKAILSVVLVLVLGATVFTACGSKHEHGFSEEWTPDETGHWHACTGEDCNEKEGFAAHVYDNDADATCNVCGYERAVVPTVKTYTITFVTNGGSPVAQIEAEAGDEITVPAAPTKSGERFMGWYESADGGVTLSAEPYLLSPVMPKKNITLYAKWQDAVIGSWQTYQIILPPQTEGDLETVYKLGDKCNFPMENTTLAQNTYNLTVSDTNISLAMLAGALNGSGTYTKTGDIYKANIAIAYGGGTQTYKTQTTYDAAHDRLLCNIVYYEDETSTLYYTLILTRVNG